MFAVEHFHLFAVEHFHLFAVEHFHLFAVGHFRLYAVGHFIVSSSLHTWHSVSSLFAFRHVYGTRCVRLRPFVCLFFHVCVCVCLCVRVCAGVYACVCLPTSLASSVCAGGNRITQIIKNAHEVCWSDLYFSEN